MRNEQGYPVKGILEQVAAGQVDLTTAEDIIGTYLEISFRKGYTNGEIDTIKARSQVATSYTKRDLTPLGTIPSRKIIKP